MAYEDPEEAVSQRDLLGHLVEVLVGIIEPIRVRRVEFEKDPGGVLRCQAWLEFSGPHPGVPARAV